MGSNEAAELLGVKRSTLYAYVSRGSIRTRSMPGSRRRSYNKSDLLRLKTRSAARAGHTAVAAGALSFGEPVLDTAISAIGPEGPIYRGVAAVELAQRGASFEEVVDLLIGDGGEADEEEPDRSCRPVDELWPPTLSRGDRRPLEVLSVLVPILGIQDPDRYLTHPQVEIPRGQRLMRQMIAALAPDAERSQLTLERTSMAEALSVALKGRAGRGRTSLIEQALILCADHELNVSTFAARVVASSGADLYACVSGAIAAMSGPAHGGACDRVEALLEGLEHPEDALSLVRERLSRGEALPGYQGHRLYAEGDPRARFLIDRALEYNSRAQDVRKVVALREAVALAGGHPPSVEHGLVAVTAAAGLPKGSATGLFAIGRTAGWLAHVIEQRELGQPLRPRARFVFSG